VYQDCATYLVAVAHLVLVVSWVATHSPGLLVGFVSPVVAAVVVVAKAHCRFAVADADSEQAVSVPGFAAAVAAGSAGHRMPPPDNIRLAAVVCGDYLAGLFSSSHFHPDNRRVAVRCPILLAAGSVRYSIARGRPGHSRNHSRSIVAGRVDCRNSGVAAAAAFAAACPGHSIVVAVAAARSGRSVVDAPCLRRYRRSLTRGCLSRG
jgi:hypothetical protein